MDGRYFDYNSTTPLRPEARDAWLEAVNDHWLNPSSPYRAAANVHARLQSAREQIAALIGSQSERIVFNSGATEGNNSVFAHWATILPAEAWIGVSPTEHPSVLKAARHYFQGRIEWLELDEHGKVNSARLDQLLIENTRIKAVSVMAANNETGILNEWAAISEICRLRNVQYHCDASQWIGKCSLHGLDKCDFVTGCAHKFGGPRGVGFILIPKVQTDFRCLLGGSQESEHRAGTEDVAGILSMVAALKVANASALEGRDVFIAKLKEKLPTLEVVGELADRLWNTVMLILPEFENTRWIRMLEKRGFFVSSGSACATGSQEPSTVLAAMGLPREATRRAVRVSSGWDTRFDDWEQLAEAFVDSYEELRAGAENSTAKVISI